METWNDEYRMGEPAAVYQVAEVKERVNPETPLLEKGDEIIDMGADFDFDGFQVVRREFFAHLAEPAVTFNNCRFYVNSACLNKFPDTNFVQVLVNRNTKIMALRPCAENARDSFAWCSISKGKRKPKQTTCKLFFAKIVSLMEWNPDYRYKMNVRMVALVMKGGVPFQILHRNFEVLRNCFCLSPKHIPPSLAGIEAKALRILAAKRNDHSPHVAFVFIQLP